MQVDKGERMSENPPAIRTLAAGYAHSLAILPDGALWAWGDNKFGQLGDGTMDIRNRLIQIGADTDWMSVTAGQTHSTALKKDGSLWVWGSNERGKLAMERDEALDAITSTRSGCIVCQVRCRTAPVQIQSKTKWACIAAGENHTAAIKEDGTLWAWGCNRYGQVGDGTKEDRHRPTQVGKDKDWTALAAGSDSTFAIKRDGSLWAWGGNTYCELGDGTEEDRNRPTRIGEDTDWAKVVTDGHTMAFKKDGSLWAWGRNYHGQMGLPGDEYKHRVRAPVRVGDAKDWTMVAPSYERSAAVKKDGTLWTWGAPVPEWRGDEHLTTPQRLTEDRDWVTATSGEWHSVAIRADGSLWTWGENEKGQLGDGTETGSNKPIKIK
jgi:alpha-tubulin suppressor-like RCC1 family protein